MRQMGDSHTLHKCGHSLQNAHICLQSTQAYTQQTKKQTKTKKTHTHMHNYKILAHEWPNYT